MALPVALPTVVVWGGTVVKATGHPSLPPCPLEQSGGVPPPRERRGTLRRQR